jgi:hypothetical protein
VEKCLTFNPTLSASRELKWPLSRVNSSDKMTNWLSYEEGKQVLTVNKYVDLSSLTVPSPTSPQTENHKRGSIKEAISLLRGAQ